MPINKYQREKLKLLKQRAVELQKTGLTMKQIGTILSKSPSWVCISIKEIEQNDKLDKKIMLSQKMNNYTLVDDESMENLVD